MKPLRQGANLPHIELALAPENARDHALGADLWEVRLRQVMLFHKKTEYVDSAACGDGMVLLFIGMDEGAQRIQERIERVLLVSPHFVQQVVEAFHSPVVFLLVPQRQERTDGRPVLLQLQGNACHSFHAPRSYSGWVSTWRT